MAFCLLNFTLRSDCSVPGSPPGLRSPQPVAVRCAVPCPWTRRVSGLRMWFSARGATPCATPSVNASPVLGRRPPPCFAVTAPSPMFRRRQKQVSSASAHFRKVAHKLSPSARSRASTAIRTTVDNVLISLPVRVISQYNDSRIRSVAGVPRADSKPGPASEARCARCCARCCC